MKLNKIKPQFIQNSNPRIGLIALATDFMIEKDFINVIKNKDIDFFDKQYFRDYLDHINWNRKQIIIPASVKDEILNKYRKVLTLLTDEK